MAEIARSPTGIGTLHEATGGDPSRSERWTRYIEPYGGEQELLVALRTTSGQVWGILGLYRAPGQAEFDDEERRFLRELAPHLAEGARRGLLIGDASEPDGPEAPGLIVLDARWQVESVTPGVERWLDELPGGEWQAAQRLPTSVVSVAARALRTAQGDAPGEVAIARVLSTSGRWMTLHGASMVGANSTRVAVIVEPAHPARISPLLMSAYALTEREQEVTQLVLRGESTSQIVAALGISAHTVQQHLKSIFEKTGVRSRRDLVSKVFFSHYEPRLRENEQRALERRPLRGTPSTEA
jgi:DNA-binding CsgD family transcriptional regulator